MGKKRKAQLIVGIALVVMLLVPVVVLTIPQTYTTLVFHEVPGPGMITMIESELVEISYIPLLVVLDQARPIPEDVAIIAGYIVLFGLGVWLIIHSRIQNLKLKGVSQWQT